MSSVQDGDSSPRTDNKYEEINDDDFDNFKMPELSVSSLDVSQWPLQGPVASSRGRNSGSLVLRGLPETWSDYQRCNSPMDYHKIWEHFSDVVFDMLCCLNQGRMTSTYV